MLDIVICVPGLSFNHQTVNVKALGGSESAGYYMAKAFAKAGHTVKLFCETDVIELVDGVQYIPINQLLQFVTSIPHDVFICQRDPSILGHQIASKVNMLWNHDLALGRHEQNYKSVLWNTDKFIVLSDYMKGQYTKSLNLTDDVFFVSRNGIDTKLIVELRNNGNTRNFKNLVYASRPERGLDILLSEIMPRLLAIDPEYTLTIAGYDNPKSELGEFYRHCAELAKNLGDRVIIAGELPKAELYKLYLSSGAYIYPSPSPINAGFVEISCITAMECQACGLPFIGSNKGALPETVKKGAGILLDGEAHSKSFIDLIVQNIINVTTDEQYHARIGIEGVKASKNMDWSLIAKEWEEEIYKIIEEKNDNAERLALHLYRTSDAIAAIKVCQDNNLPMLDDWIKEFSFLENDETMKEHYEDGDDSSIYTVEHCRGHFGTIRDVELKEFFKQHREEFSTVLDYGCNGGGYTVSMANEFDDKNIIGLDINERVLEKARVAAKELCKSDNVLFASHTYLDNYDYDAVICQEVLEHVANPWELVDDLEKNLSDNGFVYLTVPFGPWEHDSFKGSGKKFHVWHFDQHDLFEMFKDKSNLNVRGIAAGKTKILNAPCGWWVITYRKNGAKTNPIDLDRKIKFQAPQQTVSAIISAGGPHASDQAHWCLKSIVDYCDEIIISDNGVDDEFKRIADQYNVKYIKGVDPKKHGFETPRNMALFEAKMDFVLWIDLDERLVDPQNLPKYLRTNCFDGYGIRQHHFACDTQFPADMPVRLFRNHRGIKFFGMIHEHPEKGLNKGPGSVVVLSDVNIAHTGYLAESIRKERFIRNLPGLAADCEKYPDRKLQKHFLMRDNMLLVSYELQQNQGRITPEIQQRCQEVIRLYNEYFADGNEFVGVDSLQWYSSALNILNIGYPVKCTIEMNGEKFGFDGRLRNVDEIESHIGSILKDKKATLEKEYY